MINRIKNYFLETYIPNKYNHLLGILLLALVFAPFSASLTTIYPLVSILFLISVLIIIKITIKNNKVFWFTFAMVLALYLIEICVQYHILGYIEDISEFIIYILYAIFMFLAIIFLVKGLFSDKKVTGDTIKGGISIYILLGVFWSFLYHAVAIYSPNAFSIRSLEDFDFVYFSFVTIATLGYGDITPVAQGVRMLASFEAITGQLFIGIFIARLVGLHIAHQMSSNKR